VFLQSAITAELLRSIGIYTLILLVVWVGMRFIFKLTMKVFLWGLGAIVVLGIVLIVMRYLTF
jgi:hypothetical protein